MDRKPSYLTIILFASFAAVGAVLYVPALPSLALDFGITSARAQESITLFLLGYMFAQLPYGPIANVLSRKRTIYLGCALAFVGSVFCFLATAYWFFCVGRLISALGMAVGLVMGFTLVGDYYKRGEARRIISYAAGSFVLLPALAVVVGGFLTEALGWRACFVLLALYSLFIFYLALRLAPRPVVGNHSLYLRSVLKDYGRQLSDLRVLLSGIIMGMCTSIIYIFAARAPFIGIDTIGLDASEYGLWNFIPLIGGIGGGILSSTVIRHLAGRRAMTIGISIVATASLAQWLSFLFGWINPWTLFVPMALLYMGNIFNYATVSSTVTSTATDKSNAAAVMTFLEMGFATIGVFIAALAPQGALVMPLLFIGSLAVLVVLFLLLLSKHANDFKANDGEGQEE